MGSSDKKLAFDASTVDPEQDVAAAEIRSNFSDLATWTPALRTDARGEAELRFPFPDSLTTWVATARGLTRDTLVGTAEREVKTTKKVLVRLQAPRFFTERDEVVVSAIVRNEYAEKLPMKVVLSIDGGAVTFVDAAERTVEVDAGGQVRIDWVTKVVDSGEARILVKALAAPESDAMSMSFPVLAYGIDKVVTRTDVLEGVEARSRIDIDLPAERAISSSGLELTLSPSLASTMLEALPYLVEYPYGCTEQTTSRFLPAVVVARTLREMNISLADIKRRRQDLSNRDQLNARDLSPIYDEHELASIVKAGIRRLASMQNSDGGFGWWKLDRSSLHMSSYVAYGLSQAQAADYDLPSGMLDRVLGYLEREAPESSSLPGRTYAAFALASSGRKPAGIIAESFKHRDRLNILGKAQLALALAASGDRKKARLVVENLRDFVEEDTENGTCHWPGGSSWWHWYADEVETNAYVLLALAELDPEGPYMKPLVRWMINNRSGNRWKSTRDTAISVLALSRFMQGSGELEPDYEVTVRYADRELGRLKINSENMFAFDNKIILRGDALLTGSHPLVIEKKGRGSLYFDSRLSFYSKESKITAAGHEIEVQRSYYALTPKEKTETRGGKEIKVIDYDRRLLEDLSEIPAGQEIEVKLLVTARNNYEFIMLEDRKPSGFEPVALRSGGRYANGVCSNMELRDEKVVFFITWLQQGVQEISYRMRAESPGTLNAMPCRAVAMYAPRLGGISDSWKIKVTESTD